MGSFLPRWHSSCWCGYTASAGVAVVAAVFVAANVVVVAVAAAVGEDEM